MNAAIFSFFGIVVGASLQYFFGRHLDDQKHLRELRTKAYTDYLLCVCEHANLARQKQSAKGRELFVKTADAKSRICLYGSASSVNALALFERLGATMTTQEQRISFTELVSAMRTDSGSSVEVELNNLEVILLGQDDENT